MFGSSSHTFFSRKNRLFYTRVTVWRDVTRKHFWKIQLDSSDCRMRPSGTFLSGSWSMTGQGHTSLPRFGKRLVPLSLLKLRWWLSWQAIISSDVIQALGSKSGAVMRPYRVAGRLCGGGSPNRSTVTGNVKTKKLSCLNVFHHKKFLF